jgi:hypothetical protein
MKFGRGQPSSFWIAQKLHFVSCLRRKNNGFLLKLPHFELSNRSKREENSESALNRNGKIG